MSYRFVQSPNKSSRRGLAVNAIILHFTASAVLTGTVKWFQSVKSRVSAHYLVGRAGQVVQMVQEHEKAWHAGRSKLEGDPRVNSMSLGVEIVNWGGLKKVGLSFYCWPGGYTKRYDISKYGRPVQGPDGKWWAPYTEEQYQSVIKLCQEIVQRHPEITIERLVGHEEVAPGRKTDPGPAFDMERVRQEVFSLSNELYMDLGENDDPIEETELVQRQEDRAEPMSWVDRLYARWNSWHGD